MKNLRQFAALTLIGVLVVATPSFAQQATAQSTPAQPTVDPKALAAAKELVHSFDMNSMMQGVFDAMSKSIFPLVQRDNPAQSEQVQKLTVDTIRNVFMSHMDEMEENKAVVYAEMYSYDEIQQLKVFYQSPVGQKMLKTMPDMLQRTMQMDKTIIIKAMKEVQVKVREELKNKGYKVPKEMGL